MNLLLTSVGRRSYLVKYFKEIIGETGQVHVSNSSDCTPAFSCADKGMVTPLIYSEGYIPFLLQYCKENKIDALISLFDIDLPILAENKDTFAQIGTTVIVSDPKVISVCNDKWKTYQYLTEHNYLAPCTFLNPEEVIKEISAGRMSYPVMIKPRWGMGSIAVFEAENEEELRVLYQKTQNNIVSTYLKYESQESIEESVLIQEKLKGQEYGLDIINDLKGNYQTTIVKMKYAMRSGETDCAKTEDSPQLKKLGESLAKNMGHIGNLDTDVFLVGERPYILEMNARFGGGYPFSHMAGVNLPKALIKWLKNEELDGTELKETYEVLSHKDIRLVRL